MCARMHQYMCVRVRITVSTLQMLNCTQNTTVLYVFFAMLGEKTQTQTHTVFVRFIIATYDKNKKLRDILYNLPATADKTICIKTNNCPGHKTYISLLLLSSELGIATNILPINKPPIANHCFCVNVFLNTIRHNNAVDNIFV